MKHVDVKERQGKILGAIVDTYIDTVVPVGSRSIAQHFRWAMSPATIRNVMADLEEEGFIMHPHTSAGRIPTDKGYRFYVDSILEPEHLTKDEEAIIRKFISRRYEDFDSLMQNVSRVISMITNVAGVVLTPRFKRSVFKKLEFIPISSGRVLAVLITKSGLVRNSMLELGEEIEKEEFFRITEFLNHELEGVFMCDIRDYLTRRLLGERDAFYSFLKKAIWILSSLSLMSMQDRMYLEGASLLIGSPEFSDILKAREFMKAFEDKDDILNLFDQDMEKEGINIHIGRENNCRNIQGCTVVSAGYKVNGRFVGVLGAIGSTRMEYGKVISTVRYLSELLGKVLEDIG